MTTLLILTALSGWNYEGFASEPALPGHRPASGRVVVPPVAPQPPAAPRPEPPAAEPRVPAGTTRQEVVPPPAAPPSPPPPPPAVPMPVAPTMWRLADVSGQVWEHVDRPWLCRWVETQNRAIAARAAATTLPAPRTWAPANCSTGQCPASR